jgi:hypothetical protein
MKRIIDLMRIDTMAMFGKRKAGFRIGAVLLLIWAGAVFLIDMPLTSLGVILIAFISVTLVADNEVKRDYGRTFSIVPADRKSVVIARFTLMTAIITAVGAVFFVLMTVLSKAGFYERLWSGLDEPAQPDDTLAMLSLCRVDLSVSGCIFSIGFMLALIIMSVKLRNLFRNGAVKTQKKPIKTLFKWLLIFFGFEAVMAAIFVTPLFAYFKAAFQVAMRFIGALAKPFDGALLIAFFAICGYAAVVYNGICAYIYYDKREL